MSNKRVLLKINTNLIYLKQFFKTKTYKEKAAEFKYDLPKIKEIEAKWHSNVINYKKVNAQSNSKKLTIVTNPFVKNLFILGNIKCSAICDVLARFYTLKGYSVNVPLHLNQYIHDDKTKDKEVTNPKDVSELIAQCKRLAIIYDDIMQNVDDKYHQQIQLAFNKLIEKKLLSKNGIQAPENVNFWNFQLSTTDADKTNGTAASSFPVIGFSNVNSSLSYCSHCKQYSEDLKCHHCQKEIKFEPEKIGLPLWFFTSRLSEESTVLGIFDVACSKIFYSYLKQMHSALVENQLISPKPLFDKFLPLPPVLFQLSENKQDKIWKPMTIESRHHYKTIDDLMDFHGIDVMRMTAYVGGDPNFISYWSFNQMDHIKRSYSKLLNQIERYMSSSDEQCTIITTVEKYKSDENLLFECRNYYLKEITYHFQHTNDFKSILQKVWGYCKALRITPNQIVKDNTANYQNALGSLIIIIYPLFPYLSTHMWSLFVKRCTLEHFALDKEIHEQSWPTIDPNYAMSVTVKCNGENIGSCKVPWKLASGHISLEEALSAAADIKELQGVNITSYDYSFKDNNFGEISFEVFSKAKENNLET